MLFCRYDFKVWVLLFKLLPIILRKHLTTANYFLLAKMHDNFRKIRRNSQLLRRI
jgi:hypothetical protein